ncbi:unnamed protein product [Victoria cruziana]
MKVFGCKCFVLNDKNDKLSSKAIECVFIGYSETQKGYRCYDPKRDKVYVSRNVVFLEKENGFDKTVINSEDYAFLWIDENDEDNEQASEEPFSEHSIEISESPPEISDYQPETLVYTRRNRISTQNISQPIIRKSHRVTKPPNRFISYDSFSPRHRDCLITIHSFQEPSSFSEAKNDPNWVFAMNEEICALNDKHTWEIVDLPSGKKTIGCRWIFKIKTKSDGTLERYKARLVAKGYSQEYGIDYEETFAPVARMTSVRTLISVASISKWPIFQMDVKNAFLNGNLKEEVFMDAPPGLSIPNGKVLRLKKALYGLKQAPKAWFDRFYSVMILHDFKSCYSDTAMFVKTTAIGNVILLLYVDDMIITGSDFCEILHVKKFLHENFQMTDLGKLTFFLGIEVSYSQRGYLLSQMKFASDLVQKSGISDDKIVETPEMVGVKLKANEGEVLQNPTPFRQLVGALSYLTITRPDITHAVHTISQFQQKPTSVHMGAAMRIVRYIKNSINKGLFLSSSSKLELIAYTDADWGGDPNNRRSTTGFCVFLGDSLISWRCKKQIKVSLSSTEAEYRAMATTSMEVIWLKSLLLDMGISLTGAIKLFGDNKSAIYIASNHTFHERTKHIEMNCHYVRDEVLKKNIELSYIPSEFQLGDFFTKGLAAPRFHFLLGKLSIVSP